MIRVGGARRGGERSRAGRTRAARRASSRGCARPSTASPATAHAADVADALAKPFRIVVILLVAWIAGARSPACSSGRLVKHLSGGVERLAAMRGGVAFVDTGPMPQARRAQRAETIGAVLRSVVAIVIWSIAVLTVLETLGVNLAPLIAGAGIVGVALGFGAQSLVRDFLSGIFMLIEDQFGVGDVIDTGVATGTVEGVSLRTTRLRDVDGVVWHVPNGDILRVGNKSQQWARAVVDVAVAYDADTGAATEVIREVAAGDLARARLRVGHPRRARGARASSRWRRAGW